MYLTYVCFVKSILSALSIFFPVMKFTTMRKIGRLRKF
jgi:hypothetical protein